MKAHNKAVHPDANAAKRNPVEYGTMEGTRMKVTGYFQEKLNTKKRKSISLNWSSRASTLRTGF